MPAPGQTIAPMTAEAFAAWSEASAGRHELFDGRVVAMTAERAGHARLKARVFEALTRQIGERGLPCEAFPDGMAVRVDEATVFEPDALVRCGPPVADEVTLIVDPLVVVEVLSPSTQRIDVLAKLARYFRNASLAHYLIVAPEARLVIHHRRVGLKVETTTHDTGAVQLDPPGLELSLAALFPPAPE